MTCTTMPPSIAAHLAPLQGMCVPQVVESGLVRGMDVFFMATGLVEGEHPGWRMAPSCKSSAWPAAREVSRQPAVSSVCFKSYRREKCWHPVLMCVIGLHYVCAWQTCPGTCIKCCLAAFVAMRCRLWPSFTAAAYYMAI